VDKDLNFLVVKHCWLVNKLQCECYPAHNFLRAQDYSSTYRRRTFPLLARYMPFVHVYRLQLIKEDSADESMLE
jgi:hypothetical protein